MFWPVSRKPNLCSALRVYCLDIMHADLVYLHTRLSHKHNASEQHTPNTRQPSVYVYHNTKLNYLQVVLTMIKVQVTFKYLPLILYKLPSKWWLFGWPGKQCGGCAVVVGCAYELTLVFEVIVSGCWKLRGSYERCNKGQCCFKCFVLCWVCTYTIFLFCFMYSWK